jgi:hypothetical protein
MDIETRGQGPCHEECFVRRWSNVEYNRHAAARQNTFDGIFEGADLLITNATPSGTAESERDEQAAWEQTQVMMQGVADLADASWTRPASSTRRETDARPGNWTSAGTPRARTMQWKTQNTP